MCVRERGRGYCCAQTYKHTHTQTHTHQSRDWFQEMFYYLFSSKPANHNHSLSSLHPPFPPLRFLSISLSPPNSSLPPSILRARVSELWKSLMEKRENVEKENERKKGGNKERVHASLWRSRSEFTRRFPISLFREKSLSFPLFLRSLLSVSSFL